MMAQAGGKKHFGNELLEESLCKFKVGRLLLSQGSAGRLPGPKLCHMTFFVPPLISPQKAFIPSSQCQVNVQLFLLVCDSAHRGEPACVRRAYLSTKPP